MKKIIKPHQDSETGEWRYNGKWYDLYPSEKLEKDEEALDRYWDMEYARKRDENDLNLWKKLCGS